MTANALSTSAIGVVRHWCSMKRSLYKFDSHFNDISVGLLVFEVWDWQTHFVIILLEQCILLRPSTAPDKHQINTAPAFFVAGAVFIWSQVSIEFFVNKKLDW